MSLQSTFVAGVDGCRAGWAVVTVPANGEIVPVFRLVRTFDELLHTDMRPEITAVDMPVGLPERIGAGGRGPESLIRPLLGERQSSVFSIPSRSAVYTEDYREACRIALETSSPPKKVSKQAFNLFPQIRELDRYLRRTGDRTVCEVHPELAFWRLNGDEPMSLPKKVKNRPFPEGIRQRTGLLVRHGFPADFFEMERPAGVGPDDLADAAACALIARRIRDGLASSFPDPAPLDDYGIPVAIRA